MWKPQGLGRLGRFFRNASHKRPAEKLTPEPLWAPQTPRCRHLAALIQSLFICWKYCSSCGSFLMCRKWRTSCVALLMCRKWCETQKGNEQQIFFLLVVAIFANNYEFNTWSMYLHENGGSLRQVSFRYRNEFRMKWSWSLFYIGTWKTKT
jgi:hypothetical protein